MEIESAVYGEHHWTTQAFITEIQNDLGNYFVAVDKSDGQPVGYGGYWLIMDEAHVTTIAVAPQYQRKGVSEMLLQEMINCAYAKKAKWFTLEVRASNIAAQNLYSKYGFKSLGLRKKYYQDNEEDALIMWTENIWDDSYKLLLKELKIKLQEKTAV